MGAFDVLLLLCDLHESGTDIIVISTVHEDGMNAHHVVLLFLHTSIFTRLLYFPCSVDSSISIFTRSLSSHALACFR